MAVTPQEILNIFSQAGAVSNSDCFLMYKANGNGTMTASKVTAQVLRAYLASGYAVTIGDDGYFYIGGVNTNVEAGGDSGAFDVSKYNAVAGIATSYASLAAAIGTNGSNIPDNKRSGGMTIRYIDSTTGKYVQWRYLEALTTNAKIADTSNWQGIEASVTEGSENPVTSGAVFGALADVYSEINQVRALASGVKATIAFSRQTLYKGQTETFTVTGGITGLPSGEKATSISVYDSADLTTPIATASNANSVTSNTQSLTVNAIATNTKAYRVVATYLGMDLQANGSVNLRYPIYCGFAADGSPAAVAIDANKMPRTTTAVGDYSKTVAAGTSGTMKFYILIPTDIGQPSLAKFVMGGAPFVMNVSDVDISINGTTVAYKAYKSGGSYAAGSAVNVTIQS